MYHMTIDYCLRTAFMRLHFTGLSPAITLAYGTTLLVLTIAVAHLSYRYVELGFLALAGHTRTAA
jgi:hypothetical protein